MTREEAIEYGTEWLKDEYLDAKDRAFIKTALEVLKQEPCEAISIQAVLDLIEHYNSDGLGAVFYGYEEGEKFANAIKKLPPVNPREPKTGHWIKDDITERSKSEYKHKCDRCGAYHRAMYDYCPSCGAKMVEPQESEDKQKVNCKSIKCENCINHNYCDYEPQRN